MTRVELVPFYVKLIADTEAEVRTAASFKLADVCALLSKDKIISDILPVAKNLVSDKSEHVRAALASVIMALAPILGKEETIQHLLPLFLQLLKDHFQIRSCKQSDWSRLVGAISLTCYYRIS